MDLITAHSRSEVIAAYEIESPNLIGVRITPDSLSWVAYRANDGHIVRLTWDPDEEV